MATIEQANKRRERAVPGAWTVRWFLSALAPHASILLLLAFWESVAHSGMVTAYLLPPIEAVVLRIGQDIASGEVFVNLGLTLFRTLVGFSVAAVIGIVLGVLMWRSRIVFWFFDPIISMGFPMPKVAFLPIFILWFGLFDLSKIMLIIVNAVFPIVVSTVAGLHQVERELIWSARSMGASERRVSFEIVPCAALPQILTGLQVALPISLIVAVVTEMIMGGGGLGGSMIESARYLISAGVFAGIVEIAVAGFLLIKGMELIRHRLLVWHVETAPPAWA
jgi:ABC-type nitrate/sulfonate/bicarbonate transport system permease component